MPFLLWRDVTRSMAKKRKKKTSGLTRKQNRFNQKDERIQRIMTWAAIGIGALIVLILGYGIITEVIIKPNRPVATVGETEITTEEYQSRVRYERLMMRYQITQYQSYLAQIDTTDPQMSTFAQQIQQTQAQLESQLSPEMATLLGKDVLDQMVEGALIRQKAEEAGLTVTDAAIERRIEEMMGYDREAALEATASPTMTVTETQSIMTEADYQQAYTNFKTNILQDVGLSERDFREMMRTELLRAKVIDVVGQDITQEKEQAQITYIAAPSEEEASALQERLLTGEEMNTLVEELNASEDGESFGRALPWYPEQYLSQVLGPELAELAFTLPVGTVSEPTPSSSGEIYYLIQVNEREIRPLDEALLQQEKQEAYDAWLQEQKEAQVEYLDWESVTPDRP